MRVKENSLGGVLAIGAFVFILGGCASTKPYYGSYQGEYEAKFSCPLTREFIAANEYLREDDSLKISEDEKGRIAKEAASGCEGAAGRFAKADSLFRGIGYSRKASLDMALKYAKKTDEELKVFQEVFLYSFAYNALGLDANRAVQLAEGLAQGLKWPDHPKIREQFAEDVIDDYVRIVEFCSHEFEFEKKPELVPHCAETAKRVALYGGGRAKDWIQTFRFAKVKRGPNLPSDKAIDVANQAVFEGVGGFRNFRRAYIYSTHKAGLSLNGRQALEFALQMTKKEASLRSIASQHEKSKK